MSDEIKQLYDEFEFNVASRVKIMRLEAEEAMKRMVSIPTSDLSKDSNLGIVTILIFFFISLS